MTHSRPPGGLRSLVRFAVAGSAGNVVYSLVYLALAQSADAVTVPSVVASTVSTVAVAEAHRWWTFRGPARPSLLQAHASGLASALLGTSLTAVVLLVRTWLFPDASVAWDLVLSWSVTGAVGAGSFLHLRRVARSRRGAQPVGASSSGQVMPTLPPVAASATS